MDISTFEKSASTRESLSRSKKRTTRANFASSLRSTRLSLSRRQFEDARRDKVAAEDNLNLKIHLLESYFKKFAYDRLPLAQVENAAAAYYGKPGAALVSYVARSISIGEAGCGSPTNLGWIQSAS